MNAIKEYLEKLEELIDTADVPRHIKAAAYDKHESVANEHGIVTESELKTIKLELQSYPPEEKDDLIIQQVTAIEKLLKQVSDLQKSNEQLVSKLKKYGQK
jgi:hypothetical protein